MHDGRGRCCGCARDRASVQINLLLLQFMGTADGERRHDEIGEKVMRILDRKGVVSFGDISFEILSTASGVVVISFRLRGNL